MVKRARGNPRRAANLVGAGGVKTAGVEHPLSRLNNIVSFFHSLKVNRSFYFFKARSFLLRAP